LLKSELQSKDTVDKTTVREIINGLEFDNELSKDVLNSVLDSIIRIEELSAEEAASVGNVMSNMMKYAGGTDCDAEGEVTENLRSNAKEYLDRISEGMASGAVTGGNDLISKTDNFNVLVSRTTECRIEELIFDMDDEASPVIRLKPYGL